MIVETKNCVTNQNNRVFYNCLSFSSKIHNKNDIISLLGLQNISNDAWVETKGLYSYNKRIDFDGINIMWGGHNEGVFVELSGQGCRAFEEYGHGDYDYIFNLIKQNFSHNKEERKMKLTRLDVAYDDFNKILDIEVFAKNSMDERFGNGINYVTRFISTQQKKAVRVIYDEGLSLEFGSKKSDTFFRMYDKRVERNAFELDHWVRFEIQLRDMKAMAFIEDPRDIREKYFMVINQSIEYKTPNPGDSHKDRWKTAPFWRKFIENGGKIASFKKPGTEYNRDRLQKFVYEMVSGAVYTEAQLVGQEDFVNELIQKRARMNKKLNPKYEELLNKEEMRKTDEFFRRVKEAGVYD
jgi:phage replication initiation protein